MLIGTAAGTICCFFAIEDSDPSLYIVGGGVFLSFLLVALGVLGTGMALRQIVKLKKKVAQLEQKLWFAAADPVAEALSAATPKQNGIKRWLPVIIDGSLESEIDPLLTYEYRIYTAIPVELQEYFYAGEPCSFTFGFYDGFDNYELASNRAFSDDAIAECPYQFFIPFQ